MTHYGEPVGYRLILNAKKTPRVCKVGVSMGEVWNVRAKLTGREGGGRKSWPDGGE